MASAAFRSENFAEAEKHLKSVLRVSPADRFANDFLGTTYLLDGNFDAALKYWNRTDKPKLREVHIDPPLRIDPVRLDHTFAFSRAGVLTAQAYDDTRRRLDSLGIFSRYEIELTPTDSDDFDMTFRATERNGPNRMVECRRPGNQRWIAGSMGSRQPSRPDVAVIAASSEFECHICTSARCPQRKLGAPRSDLQFAPDRIQWRYSRGLQRQVELDQRCRRRASRVYQCFCRWKFD